jgi:ketosteroid isomerase-like protein
MITPLVVASFLGSALFAQDPAVEHEALRALRERLVSAFSGTDVNALADCFTPEFAFTGSDQTLATDRAGLEAYYAQWFEGDDALLEKMDVTAEADVETRFTGPESGYTHGTGLITYHLKAGPVVPIPSRWTATVRKIDGAWKVETAHIGVNILENPVMKARVGFWRTASIGAGVAGLVLGALLARMFMRDKK